MLGLSEKWNNMIGYYGLQAEHLQILNANKNFFHTHASDIVDEFYGRLTKHENLTNIIEQESTIEKLKKTQVWYLMTLTGGIIDDEYIAGRQRVGMIHAKIGLSAQWYLGGYSIYLQLIQERLLEEQTPEAFKIYVAVSKILVFDAAIILEQYIGDTFQANEEFKGKMTRASRELLDTVTHIKTITHEFAKTATDLSEYQEQVVDSVSALSSESQSIKELSGFVLDVASQTNLLGLNAAIEAARAGENGKGFAVVADEIRKLADRAKGSSQNIQDSVQILMERMDSINRQVENTRAVSEQQAASAEELASLVESIEVVTQGLQV